MGQIELLVARHGETQWNKIRKWQGKSDVPLNETGIIQARELGLSLINESISRIYSSDLQRAVTTANIVNGVIHAGGVIKDQRLRERGLGKFEGWFTKDVAKFLGIPEEKRSVLESDELSIEGGPEVEPWKSFVSRVWDSFNEIASNSNSGKILVIAHGGVMRAVYYPLTKPGAQRMMPAYRNGQCIRLRYDGSQWKML